MNLPSIPDQVIALGLMQDLEGYLVAWQDRPEEDRPTLAGAWEYLRARWSRLLRRSIPLHRRPQLLALALHCAAREPHLRQNALELLWIAEDERVQRVQAEEPTRAAGPAGAS